MNVKHPMQETVENLRNQLQGLTGDLDDLEHYVVNADEVEESHDKMIDALRASEFAMGLALRLIQGTGRELRDHAIRELELALKMTTEQVNAHLR
jgi:hypothetical protein